MGGRTRFFALVGVVGCGAPAAVRPDTQAEPVKTEPVKASPSQASPPTKAEPTDPGDTKEAPVNAGFEAVVRFDAEPSGKKFQGVWLERADGERWVVAYRPQEWLRSFEGRKVRVTGSTWEPQGQRISATHFRIDTLKVERRGEGPILEVGPEQSLSGSFAREKAPAGSKAEGETWWSFVAADGASYEVEGAPERPAIAAGVATIKARVLEPDMSFVARRGGPCVWVLEIEETTPTP